MRQILTLYSTTPDDYIIQTVSREHVVDLSDGDYGITSELQEQLRKIWPDTDMIGCTVRIVNGLADGKEVKYNFGTQEVDII